MIASEGKGPRTKLTITAQCPKCGYGDFSFLAPEDLQKGFLMSKKAVDVLCPICGTRHEGKLDEEV